MDSTPEAVFTPDWRDDVFDALEIPLALPAPMPRNDRIWVEVQALLHESSFDQPHTYEPYRLETAILKPSDLTQRFTLADQDGRVIARTRATQQVSTTVFFRWHLQL